MHLRRGLRIGGLAARLLVAMAAAVTVLATSAPGPHITKAHAWAGRGVWLRADTHTHTRFSDGGDMRTLVDRAVASGCDVLAITDHTDRSLNALTPEYFAAIATERQRHPELVLLGGFEWNIPPGRGDDHASVLLPPSLEDAATLAGFKAAFDDHHRPAGDPALAERGLQWVEAHATDASAQPVIVLNHPSRKAPDVEYAFRTLSRLRAASPLVIGTEGAPGHQLATPLGAYGGPVALIDRWDPVVADVGGVWDRLLARGVDITGALAASDYHAASMGDASPCAFSETWIDAPDRTPAGVLRALAAGAFFGVHGRIVRDVVLAVTAPGLSRPAIAGEALTVSRGDEISVSLTMTVPDKDWRGEPNRLDRLEIVAVDRTNTRIVAARTEAPVTSLSASLRVLEDGLAVRARGCRDVPDGPALCFYTNAVRVMDR